MQEAEAPASRAGRRERAAAKRLRGGDPSGPALKPPGGSRTIGPRHQNRHLHFAMLAALATASVLAFAVPISRVPAHGESTSAATTADGLMGAIRTQAGSVTAALATPEGAAATDTLASLETVPGGKLIPSKLLAAAGAAAGGTMFSPEGGAASIRLPYSTPISFTMHGDGFSVRQATSETTVGQALVAARIRIGKNDLVRPGPETRLTQGMHVFVTHAKVVRVIFEGNERLVYTRADTVGGLLREIGVEPDPDDRVFPGLDNPIRKGMTVSFVSFRDGVEFTEDSIGYQTVYEQDPDMLEGEERLVTAGVEGYVRREYRMIRLNGLEVSRELVNEVWVAPTDEVVAVGTRPATTPPPVVRGPVVSSAGLSCVQTMNVYATWYTAASAAGGGVTATGTGVYKGIVAVDPRVIPLGTRMWIPGYGYGLAADTGGGLSGNIIDLGYGPDDVKDWRSRYLDICILG